MRKMAEHPRNAVDMLAADHQRMKGLFRQYETARGEAKKTLSERIFHELAIHTALEEEIFYPAVRDNLGKEGEDFVAIALEEHGAVESLIEELKQMRPNNSEYAEKFEALRDNVIDHAEEEEETIFPVARLKLRLLDLGTAIRERKAELMVSKAGLTMPLLLAGLFIGAGLALLFIPQNRFKFRRMVRNEHGQSAALDQTKDAK
jgi:hemerythrin superfamily protein